jgi:hypothetical protein
MKLVDCSMSLFGQIGVLCVCLISGQAAANEEVAGKAIFCKSEDAHNKKNYTMERDKNKYDYQRDFVGIEFTNKKAKPSGYTANILTFFTNEKEPNKATYHAKSAFNVKYGRPLPTYSVGDFYIDISYKSSSPDRFEEESYSLDRTSLELNMERQVGKDRILDYKYSCEVLSPDALKDELTNTARWASQNLKDTDKDAKNKRKL